MTFKNCILSSGAMLRLGECNSEDLIEVSHYYSSTLLVFIRSELSKYLIEVSYYYSSTLLVFIRLESSKYLIEVSN